MNYQQINEVVNRLGARGDPALQGTIFVLENISCRDYSCPLGLYDSNSNVIILPPDYTEAALIHEVGHRVGHFYHNNLSEPFAESYRKSFQKGNVLLFRGDAAAFQGLERFEALFDEGESGAVEMHFDRPFTPDERATLASTLAIYPSLNAYYTKDGRLLVGFTKGMPWLPIILGLGAVGLAGMIGFGLFKVEEEIAKKLIPLALIAAGTFLLYALVTTRRT